LAQFIILREEKYMLACKFRQKNDGY